jgi:hypothetical protein
MEATIHHDRFSKRCWLRPQSVVLTSHTSLNFLLLPPELHRWILPLEQTSYVHVPSHVYHTHTHTFCSFKLFNNPVDSVSQWCNTNRKLAPVLSLHINTRTTRRVKDLDKKYFDPSYTTPLQPPVATGRHLSPSSIFLFVIFRSLCLLCV